MFRSAVSNKTKLAVDKVMDSVQQIVEDHDAQVRSNLVEQLPQVASICQEAPHLFGNVLHEHLLGIIIQYLQDQDNQVRQMAQAAVLALMKKGLLDIGTVKIRVCPVIEFLSYMSADYLTTGISLMSKMAPLIGKELTEKIFLDRYITLCKNDELCVRKVCVTYFGELCVAVGKKAFFQKLFPVFIDLCYDVFWGIRKACVDVMMPVACCLTVQNGRILLAEILASYLNDESKWIRTAAFQILGPFISTFATQFTEITYNQQGELVFTSQHDNHFSIQLAYEGIFPTKCAVRSQMVDTEEYKSKEAADSSLINEEPISKEDEDEKFVEEQISVTRSYKKIQKWQFKTEMLKKPNLAAKYNAFLYYYIPPDLPLDEELVSAAKKSTAENNCVNRKSRSSSPMSEEYDMSNLQPSNEERLKFTGKEIVPKYLIDSFLSMAEPEQGPELIAIPHHCAFSFPAVVLTLGRENWPYLKKAYQMLAYASQWRVRRTLAFSIHEIAAIIGEELTATDLIPIYDGFIKDLDEVRIGILKHLATFLKILKPSDRCQYLPRLKNFLATDNEWNWRFREELATQLLAIVTLFSLSEVQHYIAPLSVQLLSDKVAAVRNIALALVTQIVHHLSSNERIVTTFLRQLKYKLVVNGANWMQRQTYVFLCGQLISSNDVAEDLIVLEVLPSVLKLSADKVPNVRLAVARILSEYIVIEDWPAVGQAEEIQRRLEQLRLDPDRDVRISARGPEHLPNVELSEETEE